MNGKRVVKNVVSLVSTSGSRHTLLYKSLTLLSDLWKGRPFNCPFLVGTTMENETETQIKRRLENKRRKLKDKNLKFSSEELEETKKNRRDYMRNYRASQSEEKRAARLQQMRQHNAKYRASQSEEERAARLQQMRQHNAQYRASQSEEERAVRLQQTRELMAKYRASQSEEERAIRLQQTRELMAKYRASQSEGERAVRLQQTRELMAKYRASQSEESKRLHNASLTGVSTRISMDPNGTHDIGLHCNTSRPASETNHQPELVSALLPFSQIDIKLEPIPADVQLNPIPLLQEIVKSESMTDAVLKCEPVQEVYIKMEPMEVESCEEIDPFKEENHSELDIKYEGLNVETYLPGDGISNAKSVASKDVILSHQEEIISIDNERVEQTGRKQKPKNKRKTLQGTSKLQGSSRPTGNAKCTVGVPVTQCPICEKVLSHPYYLKHHMKYVHSENKPTFNCLEPGCEKTFNDKIITFKIIII